MIPASPFFLPTDALPIGLGAIWSHLVNGKDCPIAYASWKLSGNEKNYSQIDREATGIIFGHYCNCVLTCERLILEKSGITEISTGQRRHGPHVKCRNTLYHSSLLYDLMALYVACNPLDYRQLQGCSGKLKGNGVIRHIGISSEDERSS
ncbi:unnamed protein product [Lepeophtheirus salmonis]|uniref:(salmon louse) hypothetical protein n=1 Tax=Lepeophtheirus salmonis TaxID=72036 RepID=A0A817FD43_LEPSM|nr:unnamed protein product [Lepeophtheirus salmonis]CAG9477277.1 unnamed protein product [Lepeophtheirus salmonis]